MNFRQVKEYLVKHDWYIQAGAAKWLYVSYPWEAIYSMKAFGKKVLVNYDCHAYIKDDFMDAFLSKKSLVKIAKYYLSRQQKDKKFINKLDKNLQEKHAKEFSKCDQLIRDCDLDALSDKNLIKLYRKFSKIYFNLWQEVIFLDGYDYYGETIINDLVTSENVSLKQDDLAVLLTPVRPSFLQQERLATLGLTEVILKNSKYKKILIANDYEDAIKSITFLKKELTEISDKYHWIHNDYAVVEYLDPEYFYANLKELVVDAKKLKVERKMKEDLKNIKIKKQEIIKKYELSKNFINIAEYFGLLGNLRDERKSYNQLANSTVGILMQEIAKRSGVKFADMEHLLYWEIEKLLDDKKIILMAKKRIKGCFQFIASACEYYEFYGTQALHLRKMINESVDSNFKGMSAYGGLVKGVVKIIKDKRDFHKMNKGDILIAPNTRPEFVPVMKMAGAIVTEEGGITCHAAIVSRELKVPCIVGAQGIIRVLNDGDLVEVDATKGIINML